MDLNELQSVKSRERQTAELQQLRESFYEEVGEYVDQLERERERAAGAADDPFSDPEVQRLTDDIETAKGTVESLYERRIGKVVKQASLEAADMGAETDGLTAEERDAFAAIVDTIERNRERVLDGVVGGEDVDIDGGAGAGAPRETPATDDGAIERAPNDAGEASRAAPEPERSSDTTTEGAASGGRPAPDAEEPAVLGDEPGVDAADLMGAGGDAGVGASSPAEDDHGRAVPADAAVGSGTDDGPAATALERDGEETDAAGVPDVSHATVRVTADVGEILGVDDRAYHLSEEDVIRLPEANAEPLVERDAAERL
jgi:DNA replication factor GINS